MWRILVGPVVDMATVPCVTWVQKKDFAREKQWILGPDDSRH